MDIKISHEEYMDFLRLKDTLGFQAFLKVLKSEEDSYKNQALSAPTDLGSLVTREQSLGAMQALTRINDNVVDLVKQHTNQ